MSQRKRQDQDVCALILGGGLNGYSIARELHENGVENIVLFAGRRDFVFHSNIYTTVRIVPPEIGVLHQAIKLLHDDYNFIVTYPISDVYVESLYTLHRTIDDFCYIGFNPSTIHDLFSKSQQYTFCKEHNIPHPKTKNLIDYMLSRERDLTYPLLVKPDVWDQNTRDKKTFKTLVLNTEEDLEAQNERLSELMRQGINLLITEIVPGDDDTIYGYVAYRSKTGKILSEWIWRKLSQYPEGYGVFSTISNQGPDRVRELGREVFEKMNLHGINEIEFKYDARDDQFKYIETNFRSPMFIRLGRLTGVDVCYTQYLDATGVTPKKQVQIQDKNIHYVHFQSELLNLIARPGYITKFWRNIFSSDETYFSLFNPHDIMPMIYSIIELFQAAFQKMKPKKP